MQTHEAMAREDDKRLHATDQSENHDLVGQYLTQIGSTPLLDAQQEVELAKRIEVGVYAAHLIERADTENTELPHDRREPEWLAQDGQDAKDHMIRANLRLVVSAARKYHRHSGMAFLDVVQEGNLGLIRAVEKFDYMKGYKFSTYAMWWIRQSIDRGKVDQARTIRLPAHMVEKVSKVARSERKLQLRLDRDPTVHESPTWRTWPSGRSRSCGRSRATPPVWPPRWATTAAPASVTWSRTSTSPKRTTLSNTRRWVRSCAPSWTRCRRAKRH